MVKVTIGYLMVMLGMDLGWVAGLIYVPTVTELNYCNC